MYRPFCFKAPKDDQLSLRHRQCPQEEQIHFAVSDDALSTHGGNRHEKLTKNAVRLLHELPQDQKAWAHERAQAFWSYLKEFKPYYLMLGSCNPYFFFLSITSKSRLRTTAHTPKEQNTLMLVLYVGSEPLSLPINIGTRLRPMFWI